MDLVFLVNVFAADLLPVRDVEHGVYYIQPATHPNGRANTFLLSTEFEFRLLLLWGVSIEALAQREVFV